LILPPYYNQCLYYTVLLLQTMELYRRA
jgi:hypothetical protein